MAMNIMTADNALPAPLKALYFNATSKVTRQNSDELPSEVTEDARGMIDGGLFEAAIAKIKSCSSWESTYMGRLLMGNSLFGMGQFDAAEREYEAAQAMSDRRASVTRNNRAMVFLMRKEYQRSADLCQEGIDLSAQWPGVWVTRLCALNLARNEQTLEAAIADMDRCWPAWRTDAFFNDRLDNDPHMTGIKRRLERLPTAFTH